MREDTFAYFQAFGTLLLTIYGQIIIKARINLHGNLPIQFIEKVKFLIKLFLDPYILSGFLAAFLASILWMSAMTKLPLTKAYPIMSMAPVLVLIFGIFYLGETYTFGKITGAMLIILGSYISTKF